MFVWAWKISNSEQKLSVVGLRLFPFYLYIYIETFHNISSNCNYFEFCNIKSIQMIYALCFCRCRKLKWYPHQDITSLQRSFSFVKIKQEPRFLWCNFISPIPHSIDSKCISFLIESKEAGGLVRSISF